MASSLPQADAQSSLGPVCSQRSCPGLGSPQTRSIQGAAAPGWEGLLLTSVLVVSDAVSAVPAAGAAG